MNQSIRGLILFPLLVMWLGCSPDNSEPRLFNTTPLPPESLILAQPAIHIDKDFGEEKTISDVLGIDKVVKLQLTESSIIAFVSDLAIIDDRLLILDSKQAQLFLFNLEGEFLKSVGRLGQGPGEYTKPAYIASGAGQFLVLDTDARTLLYFSKEGEWEKTYSFSDSGIYPINDFLYLDGRAYFADPQYTLSKSTDLPVNLIFDLAEKKVLWGFERRFPPFYQKNPPFSIGYTSFSIVENHLWFGPPHTSELFIYDRDGRFIKSLKPGILNGLSLEDFEGASDRNGFRKVWRSKYANSRIFYVKPFVLATFVGKFNLHERMSVFDSTGSILVKNLKIKNNILFSGLLTAHGSHLIGTVDIDFFKPSAIKTFLTPKQKAMFVDAGWNDKTQGDSEDNAYLVFYKVTL